MTMDIQSNNYLLQDHSIWKILKQFNKFRVKVKSLPTPGSGLVREFNEQINKILCTAK